MMSVEDECLCGTDKMAAPQAVAGAPLDTLESGGGGGGGGAFSCRR